MFNFIRKNSSNILTYTVWDQKIKPFITLMIFGTYMTIKSAISFSEFEALHTFSTMYLVGTALQFVAFCFLIDGSKISRTAFHPHKVLPSTLNFLCIIWILLAGIIFSNPDWVYYLMLLQTINMNITTLIYLSEVFKERES